MKSKAYSIIVFLLLTQFSWAQFTLSGKVINSENNLPVNEAEVYLETSSKMEVTNKKGEFTFTGLEEGDYSILIYSHEHEILETQIFVNKSTTQTFRLSPLSDQLSEVVISLRRDKVFSLRRLKPVEGTAIYAGKKTEVVLLDKVAGNIASNNARQIYNKVVGLNIYEDAAAGLQLNLGGRGLDPNRSQNFNTRQNGYDISADVIGYPESYYTPPPESLEEIQVVRGAASLQYGPQFGGLINFKFKAPNSKKKIELISRQGVGSFNKFSSFNSLSGTVGKVSYYTFYNYKGGNAYRPNSNYKSHNAFGHLGYDISDKTKVSFEYTFLDYLAQQPGGLSDKQFYDDPRFSNRERNWFAVNWNLFSAKLEHQFSHHTDFSFQVFGLKASRKALGFRENRVSIVDDEELPRELLVDEFQNWGFETRVLHHYELFKIPSIGLLGVKYYQAKNFQQQGAGPNGKEADFTFSNEAFPAYPRQSTFEFPNKNLAFFGENIINLSNKLSITPGFRVEFINTQAIGEYKNIVTDLAGNVLLNEIIPENREFDRSFVLFGLGANYKINAKNEFYANFSENYRSVTFNDIRVVNPSFQVDPNITDESGFTADFGVKGELNNKISYDLNVFGLDYSNRIGEILQEEERVNASGELEKTGRLIRFRGNVGDAFIYGLETFAEFDLKQIFSFPNENIRWTYFINNAFTSSSYTATKPELSNIQGNRVEFIPTVNLKTGTSFGYKNFAAGLQYTYLSSQYTDATNALQDRNDVNSGITGEIPAYGIVDLSFSYVYKIFRLETGINNLLNESYFTRRATGYPGPGIIPSEPISWYATLQIKI